MKIPFARFFQRQPKLRADSFDSLISKNTVIVGEVHYAGTLRIDGKLSGPLQQVERNRENHTFTVIVNGELSTSRLTADFVVINGKVNGDITANQKLIITASGQVDGDVKYTSVEIANGGVINGKFTKVVSATVMQFSQPIDEVVDEIRCLASEPA